MELPGGSPAQGVHGTGFISRYPRFPGRCGREKPLEGSTGTAAPAPPGRTGKPQGWDAGKDGTGQRRDKDGTASGAKGPRQDEPGMGPQWDQDETGQDQDGAGQRRDGAAGGTGQ